MISMLAVALGSAAMCAPVPERVGAAALRTSVVVMRETLRDLYEEGVPFATFLERAEARKQTWHDNWGVAGVSDEQLARARALTGTWRILAVAVDACSDSVNSIPYVAKLADLVPSVDMRIIDSRRGREIMEGHRTPDGRAATPTLILLDADWNEVGCWVERPLKLQEWYAGRQNEGVPVAELTQQKMAWYREDAGREILREIVDMIDAASKGGRICAPNHG